MSRRHLVLCALLSLATVQLARAQQIDVDQQKGTLALNVTEAVEVDAELAVLGIGYANRASSQQAAFSENVKAADQIVQALLKAGIPKENIETEELELSRYESSDEQQPGQEFRAYQKWRVKVAAVDAQRVVDIAVEAGANEVGDVEWTVKDITALEVRANAAALSKARALAEQMAKALDVQLGALLQVSNFARYRGLAAFAGGGVSYSTSTLAQKRTQLRLFPEKVIREATVNVVFEFEPRQEKKP
ncbi:MAG: SIMPL domain-containing protein [Candidatus Acidiferrales bacterium]